MINIQGKGKAPGEVCYALVFPGERTGVTYPVGHSDTERLTKREKKTMVRNWER
jgi:hypothetical protein